MKRSFFISVAIATFNGEKFIKAQLESVLKQLNDNDEIIISDDGSTDKTLEIVRNIRDKRIKVFDGPKIGVKQNFANAIEKCNGKYIFLCDQDDIWCDDKVRLVLENFEKYKCDCVMHDCIIFNDDTNEIMYESFYDLRKSKTGYIKNIIKNSYIGCCMAFNANMKKHILPIPMNIEMHDQWIGLLCEKYGKSIMIHDKLIKYRRHKNNVSNLNKHHDLIKMIANRLALFKELRCR